MTTMLFLWLISEQLKLLDLLLNCSKQPILPDQLAVRVKNDRMQDAVLK